MQIGEKDIILKDAKSGQKTQKMQISEKNSIFQKNLHPFSAVFKKRWVGKVTIFLFFLVDI